MLLTHMQNLQDVTRDFLSEKLRRGGRKVENENMKKNQIFLEKEAELHCIEEMITRMWAQLQMQSSNGNLVVQAPGVRKHSG